MATMKLSCRLDHEEVLMRADQLARSVRERAAVDEERADTAKRFRDKLTEMDGEIARLSEVVASKSEERDVEIRETRDFRRGVVELVRIDTGEVVSFRAMTADERQTEMPLRSVPDAQGA